MNPAFAPPCSGKQRGRQAPVSTPPLRRYRGKLPSPTESISIITHLTIFSFEPQALPRKLGTFGTASSILNEVKSGPF